MNLTIEQLKHEITHATVYRMDVGHDEDGSVGWVNVKLALQCGIKIEAGWFVDWEGQRAALTAYGLTELGLITIPESIDLDKEAVERAYHAVRDDIPTRDALMIVEAAAEFEGAEK